MFEPKFRNLGEENFFKIIAFTGKISSGKTTASDVLVANGFKRVSFAQPLKDAAVSIFGDDFMQLMKIGKERESPILFGRSPRYILATLGTDWAREMVHPDIWVTLAYRKIKRMAEEKFYNGVVIDDLRFENEAKMVHDIGGFIVRVFSESDLNHDHVSEKGIDDALIDFQIFNDKSLGKDHLYGSVYDVYDKVYSQINKKGW